MTGANHTSLPHISGELRLGWLPTRRRLPIGPTTSELFQPDAANPKLACGLDFQADFATLVKLGLVVVKQNCDHMAIQNMRELVAASDDMKLVPIVGLVIISELVNIAERG